MNDQQRRGQKMLVGLILGGLLFTVLGIAFLPLRQEAMSPRMILFFMLVLAVLAGLYQGRFVPKFFTLILLFGGIILGIQAIMQDLPPPVRIGTIVAVVYFAVFVAALLFSKEIEAYMAFRQGKGKSATKE